MQRNGRERELLQEYVDSAMLMQLSTIDAEGSPSLCHVWYQAGFAPDILRFISRWDRHHSRNIRRNGSVAGGIVSIPLHGLGQRVRGVTFVGQARELPREGIDSAIADFVRRWPNSAGAIDPLALAQGRTPTRLYETAVSGWVLFDDVNYPNDPRREVPAVTG